MLRNLSEKLRAKFPMSTRGYSRVKIACLDDAFSDVFELEASPAKGQSLQEKGKKRRKKERQKNERKQKDYKDIGHRILILCMHEQKCR